MKRLQKQLTTAMDIENVDVNLEAEHEKGKKAKEVFCKAWPATEAGLTAAQAMVKAPLAKLIIGLVLLLGKGLSKMVCVDEPKK